MSDRLARIACALTAATALSAFSASCLGPASRLPSDDLLRRRDIAAQRFDELTIQTEDRQAEVQAKIDRVRAFLARKGVDGLLLTQETMFSWITGGAESSTVYATEKASANVLLTKDKVVLITSNIEAPRLEAEITGDLGFVIEVLQYWETDAEEAARIAKYCPDAAKVVTDAADPGAMQRLETTDLLDLLFPLAPQEVARYRWLGRKCAEALEAVLRVVRPGMTEYDVQYLIAREMWYWHIFPTVNLVTADERAHTLRSPVPAGAEIEKYVTLKVSARRWGMVLSMSRSLHFGPSGGALRNCYRVGGEVMAAMLAATRPGNTLRQVLQANEIAYAQAGYLDEWRQYFQGGPILTGEHLTILRNLPDAVIRSGMALAYGPTCHGATYGDTFLVTDDGLETLTPCIDWPTQTVVFEGEEYEIPALKVVE